MRLTAGFSGRTPVMCGAAVGHTCRHAKNNNLVCETETRGMRHVVCCAGQYATVAAGRAGDSGAPRASSTATGVSPALCLA